MAFLHLRHTAARRRAVFLASLLIVPALAGATPAAATEMVFEAIMSGALHVPPTSSPAGGFVRLVLNAERTQVAFTIECWDLVSPEFASHVHNARPGVYGPMLFELPLGPHKSGVWPVGEYEVEELLAGRIYINVHTDAFPLGEIRGNPAPVLVGADAGSWGLVKAVFRR